MAAHRQINSHLGHRTLVLGASGLLGQVIFDTLKETQETFGTFFSSSNTSHEKNFYYLDVYDDNSIETLIDKIEPTRIVNCIGLTVVEDCEMRPEACWKINSDFPFRVSQISSRRKIRFIHISTDHYSSNFEVPRSEIDPVKPVNQYGWSKYQAEKIISSSDKKALILRTNFFGHTSRKSKSILDFAINSIQLGKVIHGFTDVVFSPVGAHEIGRFLNSDASESAYGILNFASEKPISKYEFLLSLARAFDAPKSMVEPTLIRDSDLSTLRPKYMALDPSRLKNEFKYVIPSLDEMVSVEIAYAKQANSA